MQFPLGNASANNAFHFIIGGFLRFVGLYCPHYINGFADYRFCYVQNSFFPFHTRPSLKKPGRFRGIAPLNLYEKLGHIIAPASFLVRDAGGDVIGIVFIQQGRHTLGT
jgi:hypothetical protein